MDMDNAILDDMPEAYCDYESLYLAAKRRITTLESQLAALQWQPITPENLPKVGDEVIAYEEELQVVYSVDCIPESERDAKIWNRNGWTHFRPIAPPAAHTGESK